MPFTHGSAVDDGVSPHADGLIGVLLVLVDGGAARSFEQIGLVVRLAATGDQHEVVGRDPIHRGRIVVLDGQLILRVQVRDGFSVVALVPQSLRPNQEPADCTSALRWRWAKSWAKSWTESFAWESSACRGSAEPQPGCGPSYPSMMMISAVETSRRKSIARWYSGDFQQSRAALYVGNSITTLRARLVPSGFSNWPPRTRKRAPCFLNGSVIGGDIGLVFFEVGDIDLPIQ